MAKFGLIMGVLFGVMVIVNAVFILGFHPNPFLALTFVMAGISIISSAIHDYT